MCVSITLCGARCSAATTTDPASTDTGGTNLKIRSQPLPAVVQVSAPACARGQTDEVLGLGSQFMYPVRKLALLAVPAAALRLREGWGGWVSACAA